MNFKIVLLLFALTLLLAPVVASMPNQFKQDCMQLVKRAKVILISYSYIASSPFPDTRTSCPMPIVHLCPWVSLPYNGFHLCIGSCTMWTATRLGMDWPRIPLCTKLQVWF